MRACTTVILTFAAWFTSVCGSVGGELIPPRLAIEPPSPHEDGVHLDSSFQSNAVLKLEVSSNLLSWESLAVAHGAFRSYPDFGTPAVSPRFYRLRATMQGAADDWKNQILYPIEPFCSGYSYSDPTWVKFAILLGRPDRVYYQDSQKYLLHYDFAKERLEPFRGLDYATFETLSMYRTNQQVVLGAVLFPPNAGHLPPGTVFSECGVQFAGFDAYSPEQIARWLKLVQGTVWASNGVTWYYMPTFEQSASVGNNSAEYEARGIEVASLNRWISRNVCYSSGWAIGRLKFFAAAEIASAFADGRLQPQDILLTDGVPVETPLVAGIISFAPSTPNSHTAILSQAFGIPFVYVWNPDERVSIQQLVGRKILVRAMISGITELLHVIDLEDRLTAEFESELLRSKQPAPIHFQPCRAYGAFSTTTDALVPSDIQYFGGKAANYGLLRRCLPTNCPPAIAFSFDLWDAFLDQQLPTGNTLRAEIASQLRSFTNYPPDMVALKTSLAAVRTLFTKTASFSGPQKAAILEALAGFNPARKLRFRSSTNVEDTEQFTGAGLYDSYSGCLLDDLDDDAAGPCQCDVSETNERGVFRALQKVYASFYNDNAFLERLAHSVDESTAGMGVLVHHSFPDEEELANGVAVLPFVIEAGRANMNGGDMVLQRGGSSVTNPDGSSTPEIVRGWSNPSYTEVTLKQRSSLLPLGEYVLAWETEYRALLNLFMSVANGFHQLYLERGGFTLDFEFKKDANLGLVVKQVRQVPKPSNTNPAPAFLIDEPITYTIMQGGDVFSTHRLKSIWTLHTANTRLTAEKLTHGIYTEGSLQYLEDGTPKTLAGPLSSWPNASNSPCGDLNYWTTGDGTNQRAWRLQTTFVTNASAVQPAVLTQLDAQRTLTVNYATPQPHLAWFGAPSLTSEDTAGLAWRYATTSLPILQERLLVKTNVMSVYTSFYWPKPSDGIVAATSPLLRFAETRITGITAQPIVLTNYYSQSYGAFSHNVFESFLFEPRLEPGLSTATLEELKAADIKLIVVRAEDGRCRSIHVMGYDGAFREL